jgi:hypothetical protein
MSSAVKYSDPESLPRAASRRYYLATATTTVLFAVLVADVLYLRPGGPLLSLKQKAFAVFLGFLALYTHVLLRADHVYYIKAAQHGCKPAPQFPGDDLGIRYLVETARAIKANVMLQHRRDLLGSLGHTYVHRTFPDFYDCVTTDDFENVKAVLSTRFEDWALPSIRIKSFLPVLGRRKLWFSFIVPLFFVFTSYTSSWLGF